MPRMPMCKSQPWVELKTTKAAQSKWTTTTVEQVDHDGGARKHQSRMIESTAMTSVVLSGQAQSTVSRDRGSESLGTTSVTIK